MLCIIIYYRNAHTDACEKTLLRRRRHVGYSVQNNTKSGAGEEFLLHSQGEGSFKRSVCFTDTGTSVSEKALLRRRGDVSKAEFVTTRSASWEASSCFSALPSQKIAVVHKRCCEYEFHKVFI